MHCFYQKLVDGRFRCSRCGDETSYAPANGQPPRRICKKRGLGDVAAAWLQRIGLTKSRYAALRGRYRVVGGMNCVFVRLPDAEQGCGCRERQAWLNRWRLW